MVDTLWWLHQSRYVLQSVIVHHVYLGNIALFFSPCDYCGEASAENGALTKREARAPEKDLLLSRIWNFSALWGASLASGEAFLRCLTPMCRPVRFRERPMLAVPRALFFFACAPGRTASAARAGTMTAREKAPRPWLSPFAAH